MGARVRILFLAACAVLLSACAQFEDNVTDISGVLMLSAANLGDAMSVAETHCRKQGMWSEVRYWDSTTQEIYFDCASR